MRPGNGEELSPHESDAPAAWHIPEWEAIPGLRHGFLGRTHGLGPGTFDLAMIRDRLAAAGAATDAILAARQVHGSDVLSPEDPAFATLDWHDGPQRLPAADALVSASAGVLLTIRTADCVPILLVAPAARAVAAVHAGWRGTLAGVVERTVAVMYDRYGARPPTISAAIGPAIGGCCYEFGVEHLAGFVGRYGAAARGAWTVPDPGATRGRLDVRVLAGLALAASGIDRAAVHVVGPCTADSPATLHSYRRDGAGAGRQLSYIGWRAD